MSADDAFGRALLDRFQDGMERTSYFVERDDGMVEPGPTELYFTEYADWPPIEKAMTLFARGRVLDLGCAAGRHSLHLQRMGLDVVATDNSPLAIEVARRRGVKHCLVLASEEIGNGMEAENIGRFDSVIMMGHNIGLLHGFDEGRRILKGLAGIVSRHGKIIGTTRDPHLTANTSHLAYQKRNADLRRMAGQIRFRIRYKDLVGEWLDYLLLSRAELEELTQGTGWRLERTVEGGGGFGGISYLAVLIRE